MPIQATKEIIYFRGGLFDEMMDNCFDASVLVDMNLRIIHHSKGAVELCNGMTSEEALGKHIKELDPITDFEEIIRTGKDSHFSFAVILGHHCIQHLIPIFCGQEMIAVLGGILFRNLSVMKKILTQISVENEENHNLYNKISRIEPQYTFDDFISTCPSVERILDRCRKLASLKHSVLIIGETGTGKEILASGIHAAGRQNLRAPFIKINCSAIPGDLLESELFGHEKGAFTGAGSRKKGKFELAENGTLLLDEIGEMDLKIQAKLLRVLEEKEFERIGGNTLIPLKARIIASTNQNLQNQCQKGVFRLDLYYRLCTFEVNLPPLRERSQDIPLLLNYFMNREGMTMRFSNKAMNLLINYDWPGNVRQLRNFVNALDIMRDQEITEEDVREILKLSVSSPQVGADDCLERYFSHVANYEKEYIVKVLMENNMNIAQTARVLNIHRRTLYNKINKYQIKLERASAKIMSLN